jgi:hypothetical protein
MRKSKKSSKNLQRKSKPVAQVRSSQELSERQLDHVAGGSFSWGAPAQNTIGSATGGAGTGKVSLEWSGPGDETPKES